MSCLSMVHATPAVAGWPLVKCDAPHRALFLHADLDRGAGVFSFFSEFWRRPCCVLTFNADLDAGAVVFCIGIRVLFYAFNSVDKNSQGEGPR